MNITARKLIQKFSRNQKGVAAIEFALIFPMMVLLYFGLAELTQAIRIDRKVTQLSDTLANLTARSATITEADISNIFDATKAVIAPFREDQTKLRLSFLNVNEIGKGTVVWSCARYTNQRQVDEKVDIPVEFNQTGTVLLMAESDYLYKPILNIFFTQNISLTETKYQYPRKDTFIEVQNTSAICGGNTLNPNAPVQNTTKPEEDCAKAASEGKIGDDGGTINAAGQYVKCQPSTVRSNGDTSITSGWGSGPVGPIKSTDPKGEDPKGDTTRIQRVRIQRGIPPSHLSLQNN